MSEGHFECKVSGKRESANGIFLTLQIQPADYDKALATLRVGASVILGWAEVVNTKVEPIVVEAPKQDGKEPKPFTSLPLSQQAAIRCQDNDFKLYLDASNAEDAADKVRKLCGVTSRGDLKPHTDGGYKWEAIEAGYQQWLTTQRYASVAR